LHIFQVISRQGTKIKLPLNAVKVLPDFPRSSLSSVDYGCDQDSIYPNRLGSKANRSLSERRFYRSDYDGSRYINDSKPSRYYGTGEESEEFEETEKPKKISVVSSAAKFINFIAPIPGFVRVPVRFLYARMKEKRAAKLAKKFNKF